MSSARLLAALAWLAVGSAPGAAADLTRITRTVGKEPAYQGRAPKYCLLVFGPQARTRVWLVLDGDVLYVDRNGKGDLTEPGKRYKGTRVRKEVHWSIGDIVEADGKTRHTGLRVRLRLERGTVSMGLLTAGGIYQAVGHEMGALRFSARARDAPIVHFAGPLTFLLRTLPELVPGQEAGFIALLGTAGVGKGAAAYCHAEALGKFKMAGEVEFPRRTPSGRPMRVHCKTGDY